MGLVVGFFVLLVFGMASVSLIAKIARAQGQSPVGWGTLAMGGAVVAALVHAALGSVLLTRGNIFLAIWGLAGIVLLLASQAVVLWLVHRQEGTLPSSGKIEFQAFRMERGEALPCTFRLEESHLELRFEDGRSALEIPYRQIQSSVPDGECVRVGFQAEGSEMEQMLLRLADEMLTVRARVSKARNISQALCERCGVPQEGPD